MICRGCGNVDLTIESAPSTMSILSSLRAEPVAAVVFDMDGTLIDSETVFRSALFSASMDLGFEMTPDIHADIVGGTAENTRNVLTRAFGEAFSFTHFYDRCTVHVEAELARNPLRPKPGAVELITLLADNGIPLAVATSSRRVHASDHLRNVGLLPFFQAVVTRDDVTHPKPHPEPYLTAAQRLGVDPAQCLAFEDSATGAQAAIAAGMRTILVPDQQKPRDGVEALCALVLNNLSDANVHLEQILLKAEA